MESHVISLVCNPGLTESFTRSTLDAAAPGGGEMTAASREDWSGRHLLVPQRIPHRRHQLGLTQAVTRVARVGVLTTNRALSSLEHRPESISPSCPGSRWR